MLVELKGDPKVVLYLLTIRLYQLRPTLYTDTHTRDVVKYVMCAYSLILLVVCCLFLLQVNTEIERNFSGHFTIQMIFAMSRITGKRTRSFFPSPFPFSLSPSPSPPLPFPYHPTCPFPLSTSPITLPSPPLSSSLSPSPSSPLPLPFLSPPPPLPLPSPLSLCVSNTKMYVCGVDGNTYVWQRPYTQ